MKRSENCVFVVDDDPSIRNALKNLLRSVGLETRLFASAREFLDYGTPEITSCLILDVRMPGMSGLDLQKELAKADIPIPIIFITAHGDIPMAVRAMKAGAVDFLPKPFRDQDMLDAIQFALTQDRERREKENDVASLRTRFQELTPREKELLPLVVSGRSNKEIAA